VLVGEVAVDGRALHAGALGDGLHGGPDRADRLMQRHRRLGDAQPRTLLVGRALLLPVWAFFRRHGGGPSPETVAPIMARYGLEADPSSIPGLCERHGLALRERARPPA
jgi:hypothetical protein